MAKKKDKLPRYVRLDHSFLEYRKAHDDYFVHLGGWGVGYHRDENGQLKSVFPGTFAPWLHDQPLVEITKEEWEVGNGRIECTNYQTTN